MPQPSADAAPGALLLCQLLVGQAQHDACQSGHHVDMHCFACLLVVGHPTSQRQCQSLQPWPDGRPHAACCSACFDATPWQPWPCIVMACRGTRFRKIITRSRCGGSVRTRWCFCTCMLLLHRVGGNCSFVAWCLLKPWPPAIASLTAQPKLFAPLIAPTCSLHGTWLVQSPPIKPHLLLHTLQQCLLHGCPAQVSKAGSRASRAALRAHTTTHPLQCRGRPLSTVPHACRRLQRMHRLCWWPTGQGRCWGPTPS